ncbi:MAG: cobalt ECF transporter T component CbiQ [Desulfuromonadales bacterium]|nr:cobalt ECF transporter T component CbiQ [Desulfuromonadales bacterium]
MPSCPDKSLHSSILGRWDPRFRLIALILLAFSFSAVTRFYAVILMLLITGCFWALSGLPLSYLKQRLKYPSMLVLMLVLMLLFSGGETLLMKMGFITITTEGAEAAFLVAARFYSILSLAIALFAVAPLMVHINALRALGLPAIMVDMALLMVRYLEVIKQDMHAMNISMRLRGFRGGSWSLTTIRVNSWLVGSLLLRSYERSERIYQAMRLRGYGWTDNPPTGLSLKVVDSSVFLLVVVVAISLVWMG